MNNEPIAVLDVETTGIIPGLNRVVELAIVIMDPRGRVHDEYDTLINPKRDIAATTVHGISATQLLHAPTFSDIAGDVLEMLSGVTVVAGHNVGFDMAFLRDEYERLKVQLPEVPEICTCNLSGRLTLERACKQFNIDLDGAAHRALTDARATAKLLAALHATAPEIFSGYTYQYLPWPEVLSLKTPRFPREAAAQKATEPPTFLQRIAGQLSIEVEAEQPNLLAYMTLIDRVLQDRNIDRAEENLLVASALKWQLSQAQLNHVHEQYLQNLAVAALADGVVSESERRDLQLVARLLGQDVDRVTAELDKAAMQLAATYRPLGTTAVNQPIELLGKRVCFTGEMLATIGGQVISRAMAETLAARAGLIPLARVTKKLDVLVVADPCTESSKANKAREYGTQILADTVFWRMIGITTD